MNHSSKRTLCRARTILVLAAALLFFTGFALAGEKAQAKKQQPSKSANAASYVGSETCKGCHEDLYKKFEATPHWKTTFDTRRGPEWQGCEACHGPGTDHVAGGGDK